MLPDGAAIPSGAQDYERAEQSTEGGATENQGGPAWDPDG